MHDSDWYVECAPRFGDDPKQKASPSGGLTLKNKIKTDVWALVGMVFTNYSDTTSDSLIQ